MSASEESPSARTRVRRRGERARYDRGSIATIVGEALVCHVAFNDGLGVHCIPTACWYAHGHLYVHGSNGSRMVQALLEGEACATVTHIDGLVLARSAFHHSMNYRSVVAYGRFEKVDDPEEKLSAFADFIEALAPGRWPQIRQPDRKELAATTVLRLPLNEAAAKVRDWGVKDDASDLTVPVWAGVVPLRLTARMPVPDPDCAVMAAPRHWGE